eukprot:m.131203 g.131203  ORF g.131203 m.131203 type:complete len:70 (-) comp15742_c5_seq1:214-423(-)
MIHKTKLALYNMTMLKYPDIGSKIPPSHPYTKPPYANHPIRSTPHKQDSQDVVMTGLEVSKRAATHFQE